MKINWFSPLDPEQSAISKYSQYVFSCLNKYAKVTAWTRQKKWNPELDKLVEVRFFDENDWTEINCADINIYNIGNSTLYHDWIWEVSRICPGIVILHDQHLHHFFAGHYVDNQKDKNKYQNVLLKYHGRRSQGIVDALYAGKTNITHLNESFSLLFHAIENALGVLVHTKEAFHLIKNANLFPVIFRNLPYPNFPLTRSWQEKETYTIIIFGYIGSNRCLEQCLLALSKFEENKKFILEIYGTIWNVDEIQNMLLQLNLRDKVFIKGFVSDDVLEQALSTADLALNLRFPSMGEVSYSQLQIFSHGLPSIVTKTGWYATLSKDIVLSVRPGHEIEDLKKHFSNFLSNPYHFRELGFKGAEYVAKNHSIESYVTGLIAFIEYAKKHFSATQGLALAERMRSIYPFFDENLAERVAEKIHQLFIE